MYVFRVSVEVIEAFYFSISLEHLDMDMDRGISGGLGRRSNRILWKKLSFLLALHPTCAVHRILKRPFATFNEGNCIRIILKFRGGLQQTKNINDYEGLTQHEENNSS